MSGWGADGTVEMAWGAVGKEMSLGGLPWRGLYLLSRWKVRFPR